MLLKLNHFTFLKIMVWHLFLTSTIVLRLIYRISLIALATFYWRGRGGKGSMRKGVICWRRGGTCKININFVFLRLLQTFWWQNWKHQEQERMDWKHKKHACIKHEASLISLKTKCATFRWKSRNTLKNKWKRSKT